MEKTLSYLNSKAWYRALKVVYIFFVLFICLITVSTMVLHANYILEGEREYIKEQDAKDKRMTEIQRMLDSGYTSKQIIDSGPFSKYGRIILSNDEYEKIYGQKLKLPDGEAEPGKPMSIWWMVLFLPAYFLVAFIIAEIPKRIFYYVVLGNIRPKK